MENYCTFFFSFFNFPTLYWYDIVEIFFFSFLFYASARWLKKDQTHNLLPYLYGFLLVCFTAIFFNLTSITYCIAATWPLVILFFIVIHQTTLQRNFVALRKNTTLPAPTFHWLETLLAHHVLMLTDNHPIYCLLEHTDSFHSLVQTPFLMQTPINPALLTFIYQHATFNYHNMLWVNTHGVIQGINVTWCFTSNTDNFSTTHHAWINNTISALQVSDGSAFYGDPTTHTFTLFTKEKTVSHLTVHHLLSLLITHYTISIPSTTINAKKQEYSHANYHKKSHHRQRAS